MVSRFFGSSPFDDLVDRATSEYLPAGQEDLSLSLDVCDFVRGKQVNARDAVRSLKRRIGHRNPNVQMLALKLTDTCVKNGGHHFLVEVASRDFMDYLTTLIKQPATTTEVRSKTLGLIQNWAHTFESRKDLTYVCDVHRMLVASGHVFPAPEKTGASMIDTMTPPDWTDSEVCERCRTQFTFTNRKHHCRNCGKTFCQQCSSFELPLPHIGIHQDVRVCHGCYHAVKLGKVATGGHAHQLSPSAMDPNGTGQTAAAAEEDDDDMRRAIELSLKESQSHRPVAPPSRRQETSEAEEDAELAAAIAASLRETHISQSNTRKAASRPRSPVQSQPKRDPNDLTAVDAENIVLFTTLMEQLKESNGSISSDPQIQTLHTQINSLRPKLIKGLEESSRKHRAYLELHEKLTSSQKLYETMLREHQQRLQQQQAAYALQQQQQQQQQQLQMQTGWPAPIPAGQPGVMYPAGMYPGPQSIGPVNPMPYPQYATGPYPAMPSHPQAAPVPHYPQPQAMPAGYPAQIPQQQQQQQQFYQSTSAANLNNAYAGPAAASPQQAVTMHPPNQPVAVPSAPIQPYPAQQQQLPQPMYTSPPAAPSSGNTVHPVHQPVSGYTAAAAANNPAPAISEPHSTASVTYTSSPIAAASVSPATPQALPQPQPVQQPYTPTSPQVAQTTMPQPQPQPQQQQQQQQQPAPSSPTPARSQHQHTPSNPFHLHQQQQQQQQQQMKRQSIQANSNPVEQALAGAPAAPNFPLMPAAPQHVPVTRQEEPESTLIEL